MPEPYTKPHLTYQQQLDRLKERGLSIGNEAHALWLLEALGYYRLSGYCYPFRMPSDPKDIDGKLVRQPRLDKFVAGASFEQVSLLYKFDQSLRLLVMHAVEKLEVAVRAKLAYLLAAQDTCAHLNAELWNPKHCQAPSVEDPGAPPRQSNYETWLESHEKLVGRSKEDFVKHFREKYAPPIPLWISIEVWDFGLLSHFYAGLNESDRRALADQFGITRAVLLASWLRSISHLRNICAHHSRLWNRSLTDNPKPPGQNEIPELDHLRGEANMHSRLHVYGTLAVMQYLLKKAGFDSSWSQKLKGLIGDFPSAAPIATLDTMGFPTDWSELPLWN